MRSLGFFALAAGGCLWPATAWAFADGPPPDFAGVGGGPDCTTCHFDSPAIADSDQVVISGLESAYQPGQLYQLVIRLNEETAVAAGFQAGFFAAGGTGKYLPVGRLRSLDPCVKLLGETAQPSYAVQNAAACGGHVDAGIYWEITWQAPAAYSDRIKFNVAVNAANGDASPLGDRIHLLELDLYVEQLGDDRHDIKP